MELGESFEECAIREVYEEAGIQCFDLEIFSVDSGKENYYIYPNGDEVYIVGITYLCKNFKGELKTQVEEATTLCFFNINNLPVNISPMQTKTIESIKNYLLEKR